MPDRIVMATRSADGTIVEQDPVFIGSKDDAVAGAELQLAAQADYEATVRGDPLPTTDFHAVAEAEVDKLHISNRPDLANDGDPGAVPTEASVDAEAAPVVDAAQPVVA